MKENFSIHTASQIEPSPLLVLADSSLIMGQRLSEWCGHAPVLEQDIAVSNIALDYIGQARNWYQLAAKTMNEAEQLNIHSEDSLAYLRDVTDYKNLLIVELPNNDWAYTIFRIFLFSNYQYFFFQQLQLHRNQAIASIAEKSLKEVTYHLQWSSDWMIRLGDGTPVSKLKLQNAIESWWCYTGEFFDTNFHENFNINLSLLQEKWIEKTNKIFEEATLSIPENKWMQTGGMQGKHTEHLGFILAEMQYLQKTYSNAKW